MADDVNGFIGKHKMIIPYLKPEVKPQNDYQANYSEICQLVSQLGTQQTPLQFLRELYNNPEDQDYCGRKAEKAGFRGTIRKPESFQLAYTLSKEPNKKGGFGTCRKANTFAQLLEIGRFRNDIYVPPSLYNNAFPSEARLWWHMGLVIDIDNKKDTDSLSVDDVSMLLFHIENSKIARPSMIVCSGGGLHFYYLLNEPWAGYRNRYKVMYEYKKGLTAKIQALGIGKVDMLSVTQGHRLPGSDTKKGVKVISFKTGQRYTIDEIAELSGGVRPITDKEWSESKKKGDDKPAIETKTTADSVKRPNKKEVKPATAEVLYMPNGKKAFWSWSIDYLLCNRPEVGNREKALFALAIIGYKCSVPRATVEKYISTIIGILNHDTPNNQMDKAELPKIMGGYQHKYLMMPSVNLEGFLGFQFPRKTKRNGRTQVEHLAGVAGAKTGRTAIKVKLWRQANPEKSKRACSMDIKITEKTVAKYWS